MLYRFPQFEPALPVTWPEAFCRAIHASKLVPAQFVCGYDRFAYKNDNLRDVT